MGVAGAGKSTTGRILACGLGWSFLDADDLHSPASKGWMRSGRPLGENDRKAWLKTVRDWILAAERSATRAVVACSALKASHRRYLGEGASSLVFVHLRISPAEAAERLKNRKGHFFPASLVQSQFDTLEPPDPDTVLIEDATLPPAKTAASICRRLGIEWSGG